MHTENHTEKTRYVYVYLRSSTIEVYEFYELCVFFSEHRDMKQKETATATLL